MATRPFGGMHMRRGGLLPALLVIATGIAVAGESFDPRKIPPEKRLAYVNDLVQVPEAENAAPLIEQAAKELCTLEEIVSRSELATYPEKYVAFQRLRSVVADNDRVYPLRTDWPTEATPYVRRWLAENAGVLALLERAAALPKHDPTYTSPTGRLSEMDTLAVSSLLGLGRLALTRANACAIDGDWAAAWRWNFVAFRLGSHARRTAWAVSRLVGTRLQRLALEQCALFCNRHVPADLPALWKRCSDDDAIVVDYERLNQLDTLWEWDLTERAYAWARGALVDKDLEDLLRAMIDLDAYLEHLDDPNEVSLDTFKQRVRASTLDHAWEVRRQLEELSQRWEERPFAEAWRDIAASRERSCAIAKSEPVAATWACGGLVPMGNQRLLHVMRNAAFQGTGLVVACHQYRAKHGRFPAALAALTPEFLPKLPDDPLTGRSFVYKAADDGATFTLYSLGANQTDEGGRAEPQDVTKGDLLIWPVTLPEWEKDTE